MEDWEQNYERYRRGEPLTPELAAMLDNDVQPAIMENPRKSSIARSDRANLKELRQSEGWYVLERLMEKTIHNHVESAKLQSRSDPLANQETIAQAWAYVGMFERACMEIRMLVDAEIAELEKVQ